MTDKPQKNKQYSRATVIPHTPLRFLLHVSQPHRWWAASAIAVAVLVAGADQMTSLFFKFIVDAVEEGNADKALLFGLLFPVTIFTIQLLWRVSGLLGMQWTLRAEEKAYNDLVGYVIGHSHGYFINRFAGSILSKVHNVTHAVEDVIISTLWTHLHGLTAFLVSFVLIWWVDPLSGVIFAGLATALFFVNKYMAPKKQELSRHAAEKATELRGFIVDLFTNAAAVRQYVADKAELETLRTEVADYRSRHRRNWIYTEKMLLINVAILFVFGSLMFYILINQWSKGLISAGDFVLVLGLVSQITFTLVFIGRAFNQTARSLGEAAEGLDDLLLRYEIIDKEQAKELRVEKGEIRWNHVNFEFGDNKVFRDFNLTMNAGERVGLVGSSGAGKTTFVSLLLRQHDLISGSIDIDGQDITSITQDSLRKNIAVVPQEPLLFHRSIKENIRYGSQEADENVVVEVAKKARAHEFIETLKDGYDTLVGERGVKLSGGQRQRIAIARAMLKNAPILVLDEATSALDSESEIAIQAALHELMAGKTVVAIAHRLSTLREMDRLIVLQDGAIVEDGTHLELIERGGVYARLWKHQAGGFLQE
jgi:ATP-binding cassette subfamily B protein